MVRELRGAGGEELTVTTVRLVVFLHYVALFGLMWLIVWIWLGGESIYAGRKGL